MKEDDVRQNIDAAINAAIKESSGSSITVSCGNFEKNDIVGCRSLTNNYKADFALVNSSGDETLWISHKQSGFSYNGYGSLGSKAYPSRSKTKNPEVWAYMRWARDECLRMYPPQNDAGPIVEWQNGNEEKPVFRGIWSIPPLEIQNEIVFGQNYPSKKPGPYNCHLCAVGDPSVSKISDGHYLLGFNDELSNNGEPPQGKYQPVICAAAPIGQQKAVVYTSPGKMEGIKGWIGVFPRYSIGRIAKTKNLKFMEWPQEKIAEIASQILSERS